MWGIIGARNISGELLHIQFPTNRHTTFKSYKYFIKNEYLIETDEEIKFSFLEPERNVELLDNR